MKRFIHPLNNTQIKFLDVRTCRFINGMAIHDFTFVWNSLNMVDMAHEILYHEPMFFQTKYGSIYADSIDNIYEMKELLKEIPLNKIVFRLTIDEAIELHLKGIIKLPYDFKTEYSKPETQALKNFKIIQQNDKKFYSKI